MPEAEESSGRLYFVSHFATLSIWSIFSVTFLPFIHIIYTLITHKIERRLFRKKP